MELLSGVVWLIMLLYFKPKRAIYLGLPLLALFPILFLMATDHQGMVQKGTTVFFLLMLISVLMGVLNYEE